MSVNSLTVHAHFPADLYQGLRVRMNVFVGVICLQRLKDVGDCESLDRKKACVFVID